MVTRKDPAPLPEAARYTDPSTHFHSTQGIAFFCEDPVAPAADMMSGSKAIMLALMAPPVQSDPIGSSKSHAKNELRTSFTLRS